MVFINFQFSICEEIDLVRICYIRYPKGPAIFSSKCGNLAIAHSIYLCFPATMYLCLSYFVVKVNLATIG